MFKNMDWKEEILKTHKSQTGFFAQLDEYFKLNEALKQTTNKARRRTIIYEMDKLLK